MSCPVLSLPRCCEGVFVIMFYCRVFPALLWTASVSFAGEYGNSQNVRGRCRWHPGIGKVSVRFGWDNVVQLLNLDTVFGVHGLYFAGPDSTSLLWIHLTHVFVLDEYVLGGHQV